VLLMAVKRRKKKSTSNVSEAYEQTMLAEGAPAVLDLLGLGSTISDLIHGKPRKAAKKKRRAKKKARAKIKTSRTKRAKKAKKKSRRTSRRKSRMA
jgi:hypothetical protein